jgi:hypothetical protein
MTIEELKLSLSAVVAFGQYGEVGSIRLFKDFRCQPNRLPQEAVSLIEKINF